MILVFKTNINQIFENNARKILSVIKEIDKIDFDFEDCDNILRIESNNDIISEVETLLDSQRLSL